MQFEVIDESPFHLVVNKPAGMVTVPGRGTPKPSLLEAVQAKFGKGIKAVHRIDRVTSGCVLFAKSDFAEQCFLNAFKKHFVHKTYWAIVAGEIEKNKVLIDAPLARVTTPDAKKGPMASQSVEEYGQKAQTLIKVLARGNGHSLVSSRPLTGRMHQIRAHLQHLGHPIVGDRAYGSEEIFEKNAIALFAQGIDFPMPRGPRRQVEAIPPKSLSDLSKRLGLNIR